MNRGGDSVLSVYSDARAEYTKQLCIFLVPAYFQFFIDLLERSKREMSQEPKRILWQFQTYLNDIHEWNMERVSQEIQRIHSNCGCDYLEDLLTAVFIAHTKVLTAIRLGQSQKKVEINVPKVDHFLFKALCETAKLLWGSTYLFREGISSVEKQQNYRAIEGMLNEGILQAVRTLVPVKSILKDFVHPDADTKTSTEDAEDSDEEDVVAPAPAAPAPSPAPASAPSAPSAAPAAPIQESPAPVESLDPLEPLAPLAPLPLLPAGLGSEHGEKPEKQENPIINLDDKPSVRFGQFDAVFDSDHPSDSDMVYDPKESETEEEPSLEIMEDQGMPLGEDDVDAIEDSTPTAIGEDDYEVL